MLDADPELIDDWYILELMGHRRLAGQCREVEIAGAKMVRIDVPCDPPVTQYYSAAAIYAITPTSPDIAKRLADKIRPEPVSRYELLPEPPYSPPRSPTDELDEMPF